ncbi:MAG TPA: protein kinase [Pyrinomonadaceae bacterium]|nr:protein kinase [Pyrinomonadaceae bacterium]
MLNDLEGKLVADKYRIQDLIREGESGDLYSAHHEVLDRPVTVKILPSALAIDERWVKGFIAEARSASAVSHPNVLNLTDFGTDAKGVSYAVFENAPEQTLRQLISAEAPFDEKRALDILRQIAAGVSAAHEKKVVHGALTPENVLVSADNDIDTVKVVGFGAYNKTVARGPAPQYLAPEQSTGFPVTDERSDVYALGVMFYEMLAGEVPFNGATAAQVAAKQNSEPPPPLSAFRDDLHPEVEPIILSAIAIDPDRRYQTVTAFAEDLEILSGRLGMPLQPASIEAAAAAAGGQKRNLWQTAFIGLAGISLLAAALVYLTSVRQTDATAQLQPEVGYLPVQPIGPATGAQEESLAKLPTMTEAEIMASSAAMMEQPPGTLPGGDGYNPWANGGAPPPGAPLQQYVPPGGQVYQIDPNNPSQFMPADGGVILVPVPVTNTNTAAKPQPSPKTPTANSAAPTGPEPKTTPKPLATPPPKVEKPAEKPAKGKPAEKPVKNGEDETSDVASS